LWNHRRESGPQFAVLRASASVQHGACAGEWQKGLWGSASLSGQRRQGAALPSQRRCWPRFRLAARHAAAYVLFLYVRRPRSGHLRPAGNKKASAVSYGGCRLYRVVFMPVLRRLAYFQRFTKRKSAETASEKAMKEASGPAIAATPSGGRIKASGSANTGRMARKP